MKRLIVVVICMVLALAGCTMHQIENNPDGPCKASAMSLFMSADTLSRSACGGMENAGNAGVDPIMKEILSRINVPAKP